MRWGWGYKLPLGLLCDYKGPSPPDLGQRQLPPRPQRSAGEKTGVAAGPHLSQPGQVPSFPSALARSPQAVSALQAQERRGFLSLLLPRGTATTPAPLHLRKALTFTLISIFFPVGGCTQINCCFCCLVADAAS